MVTGHGFVAVTAAAGDPAAAKPNTRSTAKVVTGAPGVALVIVPAMAFALRRSIAAASYDPRASMMTFAYAVALVVPTKSPREISAGAPPADRVEASPYTNLAP